jgi:hypothetical protein
VKNKIVLHLISTLTERVKLTGELVVIMKRGPIDSSEAISTWLSSPNSIVLNAP